MPTIERQVLLSTLLPKKAFEGRPKMQQAVKCIDDGMSLDDVAAHMGWSRTSMKTRWVEMQKLIKCRFSNRLGVYWKSGPFLVRYVTDEQGDVTSVVDCE